MSGDSGPKSPGSGIKITGQLVTGSAVRGVKEGISRVDEISRTDEGVRAIAKRQSSLEAGIPLPGYSLFCVTFQDPPRAGGGKADGSGKFVLGMEAAGVPFGCFVLDSAGKRVADLFFVEDSRDPSGNFNVSGTAVLLSDTDLGDVLVDYSTAGIRGLGGQC